MPLNVNAPEFVPSTTAAYRDKLMQELDNYIVRMECVKMFKRHTSSFLSLDNEQSEDDEQSVDALIEQARTRLEKLKQEN